MDKLKVLGEDFGRPLGPLDLEQALFSVLILMSSLRGSALWPALAFSIFIFSQ